MSLRTGVSYYLPWSIFENRPLVAADLYYINNDVTRVGLGFETGVLENLDIRAGYILGSESLGLTAGLGFRYGVFSMPLSLWTMIWEIHIDFHWLLDLIDSA